MEILTVTTLHDETFNGGDLTSETNDGNGLSLREALGLANATVVQDKITFAADLSGGTLTLTQGEFVVSSDVVLNGDVTGDGGTPEITLDANDTSRVINITAGASTLNGLVITGGHTDSRGGGIWNAGNLILTDTTVSDSYAGTWGGGIHNDGTATLSNTTVSGNSIGDGAAGGGIGNFGTATLTNTTVSGNSVYLGTGGGIHNRGDLTLTNTTVSGNSVDLYSYLGAGTGIDNSYGTATLTNAIVLGNSPSVPNNSEILGTITQAGPNIIGGSAADVFAETVDNNGVDAGLLADNGGAVQTIALKNDASNPALDAGLDDRLDESIAGIDLNGDGDTDDVIDTDARGNGFERIVEQTGITASNRIDLGAVELQQLVSPPGPQELPSLVVTTVADVLDRFDGETSLREALALANDPGAGSLGDGDADNDGGPTDTITFAAELSGETITLVSGELVISSDVTIDGDVSGDGGEPEITLDANDFSRVIRVASGSSTFDGLVMTGGWTGFYGEGGGILVESGATVAIVNSTISGNSAPTFKSSSNYGGGVSNEGTLTLTNTTVSGNSSGGIVNRGTLMLSSSIVSGNVSTLYGDGGGISNWGTGSATLINTTVSDNSAGSLFSQGGGISGPATLINSTVSGNSAFQGGGISGPATLINTTVSGNDALYDGGISGLATLTNSIVLGNSAKIDNPEGGSFIQNGPNIIGGSAADVFAETVDNDGVAAGLLADNGGPVQTIALKVDASNPAIDAGDDTASVGVTYDEAMLGVDVNGDGDTSDIIDDISDFPFDARGNDFERIIDQTGITARNQIDLGAVELQQIVSPPGPQETPSLVVTTTADVLDRFDGETSLREALALANDPGAGSLGDGDADNDGSPTDTITFAADLSGGTITLASGELVIGSEVAIDGDVSGDGGAPEITLDANDASRVIEVTGGSSTLDGLVMTGGSVAGYQRDGGGVFVASEATLAIIDSTVFGNSKGGILNWGTATLTNTTVSGNTGGGIRNEGILTLTNATVSGNSASFGDGGGIWNTGTLTLSETTVSSNSVDDFSSGGGIRNSGTATLTDTTVSDNAGGGISNSYGGTLTLSSTMVSGNQGPKYGGGGGIDNEGTATLTNTTVSGNGSGVVTGGGIDNGPSASLTLANTTVSGNEALDGGGGIINWGTATLTNTTVSANNAGNDGGGIANRPNAVLTLTNTTVSGNNAEQEDGGGGINNSGTATLTNSIVLSNSAPAYAELRGTIIENGPNIIGGSTADVFAGTGLLADNGGAVQTIALKNDRSNPALDAGQDDRLDESVVGVDLNGDGDMDDVIDTDARGDGFERFADQPHVSNNGANTVDLGSFELPAEDPGGPDLTPVTITFKGEDAWYSSAFGIYDRSTMTAQLLAADIGETAEGAVLYEAALTQEQLDNLGFFLLPDGARWNADLASLVGEDLMVVHTAAGYAVSSDGMPLSGRDAPAFFSDASLNPGGIDHFVEDGTPARYCLSVEDLAGGGDEDFDDALFLVEAGVPKTGAEVTATFESESAFFHNTFGYFMEDTGEAKIIFAHMDETTLPPGTTETFDLTAEEYDNLEFFLIPDGGRKNADLFTDLDALDLIVEEANGGLQARDQVTGTVLEGYVNPVYVPEKAGNPDATRHALQIGDVDAFELRWEDLPDGGDKDYDDTVVSIAITPDDVLI